MDSPIIKIDASDWHLVDVDPAWISGLENGGVLYFPNLPFPMSDRERALIRPDVLDPKVRNISLAPDDTLKGAAGDPDTREALAAMIGRFREQAYTLIHSLLPKYRDALRPAPTSYRPAQVETRKQSVRADDRRLHVDAFPSRPNYGERILRVFRNINPQGVDRVWRLGEPFEEVARRMLRRAKPYSPWQAKAIHRLHITKSLRSEYDHLMLQLHDAMKTDEDYQKNAPQMTMAFPPGAVWVCFSDQVPHAVMSGQYLLEQTLHLSPEHQYRPDANPLGALRRLTHRPLI